MTVQSCSSDRLMMESGEVDNDKHWLTLQVMMSQCERESSSEGGTWKMEEGATSSSFKLSQKQREKWFLRHSVVRLEAPVVHDGSTKKVLQLGQSVRQWLAVIDRDEFHRLTRFSAKPLNDSSQSWPPATPLGRYRYRPNPIPATAPAVASATILCQLVAFKLWYRHRFHFHFSLLEFTTAHSVRHLIAAHWRHSLQLLLHTTLVVFLPFFLNWTNPRTVQLTGSTNRTTDN